MIQVDRRSWLRVAGSAAAGLAMAAALPSMARSGERGGEGPHGMGSGRRASSPHPETPPPTGVGAAGPVPRGAPDWTAAFTARLEALADDLAGRRGVASAVLGVSNGDGSFRWTAARGVSAPGGPPMTSGTPWFTASITKLFIASTFMRLVEEGEASLLDRVTEILPRELTRGLHVMGGVDRTGHLTAEHLLAHASGLPDFIEDLPHRGAPDGDRRALVQILLDEGDRDWTLEDTTRRVRDALRPHFPPQVLGAGRIRIRYSDTNYQLLIGLMEARTGVPFHELLETRVLEPLELDRTWLPGHPRPGTPAAPVASLWSGNQVVAFPRFFRSIADLHSTVDDQLLFLRALQRGGLFEDPATWRRMQTPWNRFPHPLDRAALRQPGWPIEYGLGVMRFELPRFLAPIRPVPPVIGHTGSTGTWLFHAPELDLYMTGAVSQITAGPLPYRFVPRILRAALDAGVGPR